MIMDKNNEEISGIVEEIIFQSEESGYTICDIEDNEGNFVTLTGNMPFLNPGDGISAVGKWVNHPTYGRQFSVSGYTKKLPEGEKAIEHYLASGAISGIGPKTARKIVEKFGDDTFDVLENHPDWLCEIPGISPKRASNINESFLQSAGARQTMVFCSEYIGTGNAMKVYKKWGGNAVNKLKENPYILCTSALSISFTNVDKLAASCGFTKDSFERIDAGILCFLAKKSSIAGHSCYPKNLLIDESAKFLEIDNEYIPDRIDTLSKEKEIEIIEFEGTEYIYLKKFRKAEMYTAQKLKLIKSKCPAIHNDDIAPFIKRAEINSGLTYAPKQSQALAKAMEEGVLILTGGPGTGKTTIIKGLIDIFDRINLNVALAAPTGRAAKRMSEATGYEAKTIHRLLEMERGGDIDEIRFARNEDYYLDENVIIIDEFSMVDILLFEALLRAIKPGSRLIMIGDKDQLPSVGAGNVLADLILSNIVPTIELSDIFRQAENSKIIINAHEINNGIVPSTENKSSDFFFINRNTDNDISNAIIDLVSNRLPKAYGESIKKDIQIITPSKKGEPGTVLLNQKLQNALNPHFNISEINTHGITLREHDKVMQNKNNYDVEWIKDDITGYGIFNGDIGTIEEIDKSDQSVTINFDGRIAIYDFTMLEEIEHAYAITVHKSQGSEYPVIIMPLYNCAPMLLNRNLLYTAVTRASKMVILVGKKNVLETMVNNNKLSPRYSAYKMVLIN